jgi:uncharacterized protein (DUF2141 family)
MKEDNVNVSRRFFLKRTSCALAVVSLGPHLDAQPSTSHVTVKVSGIRNNTGRVIIGMWNSQDGFPKDRAKAFRQTSVSILNDMAVATFSEVPYGEYAVALFHDENNNGRMDTRFPGIPVEGIGSSNNPHPRFSAPTFSECRFEVSATKKIIEIKMLY